MEYRLYGFTLYQLSGIQAGIQFGHAAIEYSLMYGDTPEYKKWAINDKTFIVLDGGSTSTMADILTQLQEWSIPYATFEEPDLGFVRTAIVFLVDEYVWNSKKYPDPDPDYYRLMPLDTDSDEFKAYQLRTFLKQFRLKSN